MGSSLTLAALIENTFPKEIVKIQLLLLLLLSWRYLGSCCGFAAVTLEPLDNPSVMDPLWSVWTPPHPSSLVLPQAAEKSSAAAEAVSGQQQNQRNQEKQLHIMNLHSTM